MTAQTLIELNRDCLCFPIERAQIDATILRSCSKQDQARMAAMLRERENYFANTAVFLANDEVLAMQAQIAAIEQVVDMPAFRRAVFTRDASRFSHSQANTCGAFLGYDFHLTQNGPRLIEINTNAGGAFVTHALEQSINTHRPDTTARLADMFVTEWRLAGRVGRPKTLAIIDDNPLTQYHYPDMYLAAEALRSEGFRVYIADPRELRFTGLKLQLGGVDIDLVYNRLTDFGLTEPRNEPLRNALHTNAAVITPSPRHHAMFADKRNLVMLSDGALLSDWGVPQSARDSLTSIPAALEVTQHNAATLWRERRNYFFKPHAGFGSRGSYRGAKLTKKVWHQIVAGGYIAQRFVAPPSRALKRDTGAAALKFDVRVYGYAGHDPSPADSRFTQQTPLLLAARVYQGQTTNLRTAGGGLSPIIVGAADGQPLSCCS